MTGQSCLRAILQKLINQINEIVLLEISADMIPLQFKSNLHAGWHEMSTTEKTHHLQPMASEAFHGK